MVDPQGDVETGAARVAGIYLAVGLCWIVLTDLGVFGLLVDPALLTGVQTTKGVLFVTASAGLLYVLVASEQRRLAATNEQLQLTLRHASVLHRLLRHNLRNSCDVIMNNVALLRHGRSDRAAAHDRIERQTEALVDIAEKSRHLRDPVLGDDTEPRPIDLAAVVREQVTSISDEYPEATLSVDACTDATAVAHPRIELAIEEVLANAITHATDASPTVSISLREDGEDLLLEVSDDGPGLPPIEGSVLEGGLEEPLEHSRGLGLWLVHFLVAKSGGSVTTRTNEPSGTVVELRFERAATPDSE